MKKFSKILVAVLALCLLVGALALAVSADSGVDGKFVVNGTGYETWGEALEAANNTHTIYLNEDWTPEEAIKFTGADTNVKLNLNGKTVTVNGDISPLFNVVGGAKFTVEGEGVFNNVGYMLMGGSGDSVTTINATGAGMVINHRDYGTSNDPALTTFRFYSSTINVSGSLTVNTAGLGSKASRAIFQVADNGGSSTGATLNITNAKILYAKPQADGAPVGKIIYFSKGTLNISNSELKAIYGILIQTKNSTRQDIKDYMYDWTSEEHKGIFAFDPDKVDELKKEIKFTSTEFINAEDSKFISVLDGYGSDVTYNVMALYSAVEGNFSDCYFEGHYRMIGGNSDGVWGNHTAGSTNIDYHYVNESQLTFTNCDFAGPANNLFCYGPNFKVFGGKFYNVGTLANGQVYYTELTDEEGNPTGQWLGGYVENVFAGGNTGIGSDKTVVTSRWQNVTSVNPDSDIKGALPYAVSFFLNGVRRTFTAGYVSDELFATGETVKSNVIYKLDGSTATPGAYNASSNNPFKGFYAASAPGTVVKDETGNTYLKHSFDAAWSGSGNTSVINPGFGSFADTDFIIMEMDISSDGDNFARVAGGFQTREYRPHFDANGNFLGASNPTDTRYPIYLNKPYFDINLKTITLEKATANLSTDAGVWNKITIVFEMNRSETKDIQIPAYQLNGTFGAAGSSFTALTGEGGKEVMITKKAFSIAGSKIHLYVNGQYAASSEFALPSWGYTYEGVSGYIIEGYESQYKIGSDIRASLTTSGKATVMYDNIYVAKHSSISSKDLGIRDENGALKTTITPGEFLLVMEDLNAFAKVDGKYYNSESDAIAAIKDGSIVEFYEDCTGSIAKDNIGYTIITNGYTLPTIYSKTHKLVDNSGMGYIELVPAAENEFYTINYEFNGIPKTQKVPFGTAVPEMTEYFDGIVNGTTITNVVGWTVPDSIWAQDNVITAIAQTEDSAVTVVAGDKAYTSLADAVAYANGATITLLADVTVDASAITATTYTTASSNITGYTTPPATAVTAAVGINVTEDTTIDLNGFTVTQNFEGILFNVTSGTLTLTGSGAFENVGTVVRAAGENAKIVIAATGDGFDIKIDENDINEADGERYYNVFVAEGKANVAVSGVVDIKGAMSTIIFKLTGADTAEFNKATVVSHGPTLEQGNKYSKFFLLAEGNTVNIEASELTIHCGDLFVVNADTVDDTIALGSYMPASYKEDSKTYKYLYVEDQYLDENGRIKDVYFPEFTINVTANNSTLRADTGNPKIANQDACGGMFRTECEPIKVVFTNCDLYANNRPFDGGARPQTAQRVSPNQFTFINVNYTEVDNKDRNPAEDSKAYSTNLMQENINLVWVGGTTNVAGVGCAFVPTLAQNGVIGLHIFNVTGFPVCESSDAWYKAGASDWTRYYASYKNVVAIVDGVIYKSEAEALAAIKEGSSVLLINNFNTNANLSVSCKFDTNYGYFKAPGVISATHKVVNADGIVTVSPAAENEIFTINYAFGDKTATQTAALGTVLATPNGIADRFFDAVAKKVVVLEGWTLVDGENVTVVTGNADAIALTGTADPVIVYWTDANGETVLDTDYYIPGEVTVLPDFDGTDVAVDHSADYYGIGRTGWDGIDKVNLAAAGEYTVTAVMGKVAPDTFPGLKYNVSLYSNFVLNLYVPMEIEGISGLTVSTVADGSVAVTKFDPGTLGGVPYDKYGYILGVADTEIQTFYIVYNVGEDRISFPVCVGVPTYAAAVMDKYAADETDKGTATKSLIVNMANYATKVLALNSNEVDMEASGVKIYNNIVATYGEEYLGYYAGLTNDRFATGGDLYTYHKVADLNYIKGYNETVGDNEALQYIESITFNFNTFEPAYVIKYSDAAIDKGISKPGTNGVVTYQGAGLHIYTGYGNPTAATTWAEKDGVKYYEKGGVWAIYGTAAATYENKCNKAYEYYTISANNAWKTMGLDANGNDMAARQEYYKIKNIRNDLVIRVYWSENNTDKPVVVGEVNYNLAAYINSMLGNAEGNAAFIEAARAVYAFSYVSSVYAKTK